MVIVSLSTKLLYWNRMRLQLIKQLDDISTLQMGLGQVLEHPSHSDSRRAVEAPPEADRAQLPRRPVIRDADGQGSLSTHFVDAQFAQELLGELLSLG